MEDHANPATIRAGHLDCLRLMTDPKRRRAYKKAVPIADVVGEIFEGWYDFYLPEDPVMSKAFSADELAALKDFDQVLDRLASGTRGWSLEQYERSVVAIEIAIEAREVLRRLAKCDEED